MQGRNDDEWRWYRCSILGCGAGPLRVRPHHRHRDRWSVGFEDSLLWLVAGQKPVCPRCGDELDALATA